MTTAFICYIFYYVMSRVLFFILCIEAADLDDSRILIPTLGVLTPLAGDGILLGLVMMLVVFCIWIRIQSVYFALKIRFQSKA